MMNINQYAPKHINLSKAQAEATQYVGTFSELHELIKAKKVALVVKDDGEVTGIHVDSGNTNLLADELAGRNFSRAYGCKPIMKWVEMIIAATSQGKQITDINEAEGTYVVDGEVLNFIEMRPATKAPRQAYVEDLPTEVTLNIEDDLGGETNDMAVALYLRNKYDHYLSGQVDHPFVVTRDEDDGETVHVTDISWGRKR